MGKPKHSNDTRGEQKGAQQHDEGQYGPKAFEAKRAEVANQGARREREPADPGFRDGHERELEDPSVRDGRHRLSEERKQHDEADRAQAKNHLIADIEVHGHDRSRFQVPGGRNQNTGEQGFKSPGESGK